MKEVYCAECGERIEVIQKAVPSLGRVYDLIHPHNCLPTDRCEFYPLPGSQEGVCLAGSEIGDKHICTPEKGRFCEWAIDKRKHKEFKPVEKEGKTPTELDKIFDSFKFVQKLNGLSPKRDLSMAGAHEENYGDKRDKEHLRKELPTSTAPAGVLSNIKTALPSQPENDISEEPEED